ncbi:Serine/threonine-protein kinase PknB [Maioricimonas rarisocia]|uniref:Serine/threonine-protein kinase PknB n=1 Tax=Maioricimonas rarisocia TaxID=2528026 RepID=A0A517ZAV3_9PLAN|nr:protein kinase [Maioricimonas rarisocia]QDU39570.1 Serine/threonine-protein kinase PknB [Maioricimonas rarisocia]
MSTREELLFYRALRLGAEEREPFLDDACGENRQLRRRLSLLLEANDQQQTLLDRPVAENVLCAPRPEEAVETTIGGYTLKEQIGEGTFGVVYVAEQTRPVRRAVALKLVKPGMDSAEIVERFEAERQTLALMEHPNIALILDGGTTATGRPYFVMELVRGVPMTEYCDQHALSVPERLHLFLDVCSAVEHAHQKGVIHRDLKPSNILVTTRDGAAVPKVIDFGVAKVMAAHVLDVTISTHCAQLIGTPAYMSPEQAELSNVDVDTRSDVYSLGVLLYELLTGDTPHSRSELRELRFDELRRVIQEVEPSPPSRVLRKQHEQLAISVARLRSSDVHHLQRIFRGELDWIVLKALSKQRDARYQSAGALAADLRRHLAGHAVEAGPPSTMYLLRKFAQRHRHILSTALAVAVILLAATGISLWQSIRATLAEKEADRHRREAVSNAMLAKSQAEEAQRLLYASDIRLAAEASSREDITRMRDLLAAHIPEAGEPDRRGFAWHYLWKQNAVSSEVLATFEHALYFVALSTDGAWLACCGASDDVSLFDARTLQRQRTIDTGQGEVNGLAFSHDSRWLASTGDDGCVALWDLQSGKEVRRIKAHANLAYQCAFTPDDSILATCGDEPTIRLWDPRTGESLGTLAGTTEKFECLAISSAGLLAAGSRDHTARIWHLPDRQHILTDTIKQITGIVGAVTFDRRQRILVTGTGRGLLSVIEVNGEVAVRMRRPMQNGISAVAVSDDATSILVGDDVGLIHQLPAGLSASWMPSNEETATVARRWQAHDGGVASIRSLPEGRGIVSCGSDGRLVRWRRETGGRLIRPPARASQLDFVGPDTFVAVDNTVRLHDARTGSTLRESVPSPYHFIAVAVAPGAGKLFAASNFRVVSASIDDMQVLRDRYQSQSTEEIRGLAADDAGTRLAMFIYDTAGKAHQLALLDTTIDRITLTRRCSSINAMAFSPDGNTLAFSQNNDICLLNVTSGQIVGRLVGHGDSLQTLDFSPDGQQLASGSDDRTIRIWDVSDGRQLWMTIAHANSVRSLAFSPEGQTVVSGGDDSFLRLWRWRTGRMLCELPTERAKLLQVRFSPDGHRIATLSGMHRISLFDGTPTKP